MEIQASSKPASQVGQEATITRHGQELRIWARNEFSRVNLFNVVLSMSGEHRNVC